MRLRARDKRQLVIKPRTSVTEADGTTIPDWGAESTIEASVQPAGGRLMAEMYGERLAYMLTLYMESEMAIPEGAGVHVYSSDKPDYRVVAVRRWQGVLVADLEAIR